ncbi:nucleoside triphosphate pyrophosphohydrolase [Marinimicrobium sp. ARAG 43.8]|uniref:nucleoside triphosphate pyrophosphohydrolase n=1 Tax=Marinimicrobium sp. ARAG 43.8 TaxID=3418719 RepID=UPI003CF436BA
MPYSIDDLLYLMARLREPGSGCPWDLKQSYRSIAPSTLEEAYEVVDTIERGDYNHLREELGDLLFQVIFYSQLGHEDERFDFAGIVDGLVQKLIRRHPHVFPEGTLESRIDDQKALPVEVKQRWETIKQQEREAKGVRGTLDDVPLNLPALTRAAKLQKRAAGVGFDWPAVNGPLDKVREETDELVEAIAEQDHEAITEELGDLLFTVTNVARHLKIDPEAALRSANRKFERRFGAVEAEAAAPLQELSEETLDALWNRAKASEKSSL